MSKKIKFVCTSEYAWENIEKPKPASLYLPKWWKNLSPYDNGGKLKIINGISNATPKKCIPMLDAIRSGYIISLWSDVLIEENDYVDIKWRVKEKVFDGHGSSSEMVPAPSGYHSTAFKYVSHLTVETPKGYSILITPPMGHYDLPFLPISAIIDSDRPTVDLAFPLWIKKGSAGIVEKGTPVVQVTPFKRENWSSSFSFMSYDSFLSRTDRYFRSTILNNYLKNTWSPKKYD